jgi:hypothetical protein
MVYSGAWGKLIHEKYQKSKIWRHCPFKLGCGMLHGRSGFDSRPACYRIINRCRFVAWHLKIVAVLEDKPSVEEYEDKFNENKEKNVPRNNYKF